MTDTAAALERLIRHGGLVDDETDGDDLPDDGDDGFGEAMAVVDALVASGDRGLVPRARAALLTFLDDRNFYGRDLMAQLLAGLLGPEALPILLDAAARDLGDDQDSLAAEIVDLLQGHRAVARSVVLRYATDPDPTRRREGLWALGFVVDVADLDLLASAAVDPDPEIRSVALGSLGGLSTEDRAFAVLVAGLNDVAASVRSSAVSALGYSGRRDAVAPLLTRATDPDGQVRRLLAHALGSLGEPAATPA
ncbi:HEAT repeat domain-containing protein [Plantactinospora sp. B5E13]|uniref:HEAT repeat domain-containing protein n=1 Tax=unclassified Plantactinospora TaxID=2631981 RepID=UPI00325DAB10